MNIYLNEEINNCLEPEDRKGILVNHIRRLSEEIIDGVFEKIEVEEGVNKNLLLPKTLITIGNETCCAVFYVGLHNYYGLYNKSLKITTDLLKNEELKRHH